MSFILDALKKSEQERERQQRPATMDISYGRRNRTQPLWMLAVIGLLVLNCVLLLVMWWRNGNEVAAPATVATASSETFQSSSSAAPLVIAPPRTEVRPLQEEASNETEVVDETAAVLADATPPDESPLVRPATPLERAMAQQQASATNFKTNSENRALGIPSNDAGASNGNDAPTLNSLGGSGALNLPDLRLDVHVYSSVASERFAFINSRKYLEGQSLNEGPLLEKITQDGVVLSYRSKRFLLPRQ